MVYLYTYMVDFLMVPFSKFMGKYHSHTYILILQGGPQLVIDGSSYNPYKLIITPRIPMYLWAFIRFIQWFLPTGPLGRWAPQTSPFTPKKKEFLHKPVGETSGVPDPRFFCGWDLRVRGLRGAHLVWVLCNLRIPVPHLEDHPNGCKWLGSPLYL